MHMRIWKHCLGVSLFTRPVWHAAHLFSATGVLPCLLLLLLFFCLVKARGSLPAAQHQVQERNLQARGQRCEPNPQWLDISLGV